jgi:hypothetical protein
MGFQDAGFESTAQMSNDSIAPQPHQRLFVEPYARQPIRPDIGRCPASQLIRRDHRHGLRIRRDCNFRHYNYLAIALVSLLYRAVIDSLQRDRTLATRFLDRVVFAV